MDFQTAVLVVLLKEPRHGDDVDESDAERLARFTTLSEGTTDVANEITCSDVTRSECKAYFGDPVLMVGMLLALAKNESHFSHLIQNGECKRWECDPYKDHGVIKHAARGLWQPHYSTLITREEWDALAGTSYDSVYLAAKYSARLLAGNKTRCRTLAGAFSGYAKGGYCYWDGGGPRARDAIRYTVRIRNLMAKGEEVIATK